MCTDCGPYDPPACDTPCPPCGSHADCWRDTDTEEA